VHRSGIVLVTSQNFIPKATRNQSERDKSLDFLCRLADSLFAFMRARARARKHVAVVSLCAFARRIGESVVFRELFRARDCTRAHASDYYVKYYYMYYTMLMVLLLFFFTPFYDLLKLLFPFLSPKSLPSSFIYQSQIRILIFH